MYNANTLKDLDKLYSDYVSKCDSIKGRYPDNDVRLSYYYLSYQNIDAAIHMLLFNKDNLEEEQLRQNYRAYNIKNRFNGLNFPPELKLKQMRTNFEQFIANQYSLTIFCLFEHCFRIIIRQIYPAEYRRMEKGIMDMFKFFVKKFRSNSVYFLQLRPSSLIFLMLYVIQYIPMVFFCLMIKILDIRKFIMT